MNTSAPPKKPTVVVIAGPNGAGKSTAAPFLLKGALGVLEFVNADQIAVGLSAYAPEAVSFEAGRIMLRRFQRSLSNLFELYLPLSDRWSVLDNAGGRIETIAAGTPRRTSVKDPEKWLLLQSIAR